MNPLAVHASANASEPVPMWGPPRSLDGAVVAASALFAERIRPMLPDNDPVLQGHRRIVGDRFVPDRVVSAYLDQLSTLARSGHPSVAWACINVALDTAVQNGSVNVIQLLVSVPSWKVCTRSSALESAARSDMYADILPILISDARFRTENALAGVVRSLVGRAHLSHNDARADRVLCCLLSLSEFPPTLVWDQALRHALMAALRPNSVGRHLVQFFHVGQLVDTAQWQFEQAQSQWNRDDLAMSQAAPVPPRLLLAPFHPALLMDLPFDLRVRLHAFLNPQSLCALRLTCRALGAFPTDCYSQRRVVHELERVTVNHSLYDSSRLKSIIGSVPGRFGPPTLGYRTLIEAVRHLDLDLALKVLQPQPEDRARGYDLYQSEDPRLASCVLSWSLFLVLKELIQHDSGGSDQGMEQTDSLRKLGILLHALLLHPMLCTESWCLIPFHFDLCRNALMAATPTIPEIPACHAPTPIAKVFVELIRTGCLRRPIPCTFVDNIRQCDGSYRRLPSECHVFLLLTTLSGSPTTFTRLMTVFPQPVPPDTQQSLLCALCDRPDPAQFFTHVMHHVGPVPQATLRVPIALRAKRAGNEDVLQQLLPHLGAGGLYELLFPLACGSSVLTAKLNALLLTHWLRRAGSEEHDAEISVDWSSVWRLADLCTSELQAAETEGDCDAGVRLRELQDVWEPIRRTMAPVQRRWCWTHFQQLGILAALLVYFVLQQID